MSSKKQTPTLIDVEKVLKTKSPRLSRFLPRFVINYLTKIIHQQEVNDFIKEHGHKQGLAFTQSVLSTLQVTYTVNGFENLKENDRYIFVANHPLGGPDGMILIDYFGQKYQDIKFPVNDILLNLKNLSSFFLPINKHGKQSREAAKKIEDTYASNSQILFFPAGLVSRKKNGIIRDLEWKKNFVSKSIKHNRSIVPVHISGRNSNFFYRLSNLRSFLGLKINIEMLYLSDELFKQKGKSFQIHIGKPISPLELNDGKPHAEWASLIKEKVYQLASEG